MIRDAYQKVDFLLREGIPMSHINPASDDDLRERLIEVGLPFPQDPDVERKREVAAFCWNSLGRIDDIETSMAAVCSQIFVLLAYKRLLGLSFTDFVSGASNEFEAAHMIVQKIVGGLSNAPSRKE